MQNETVSLLLTRSDRVFSSEQTDLVPCAKYALTIVMLCGDAP